MAVIDLMDDHPELAIAFRNVACSGAVIENLWSNSASNRQVSNSGNVTIPFQLDDVRSWLEANTYNFLDILIMSIGGNNTGFSDIVIDFLLIPLMDFHNDSQAQEDLADAINQLNGDYDNLNTVIHNQLPMAPYPGHKPIILTGYPSPIEAADGSTCGTFCPPPPLKPEYGDCWGIVECDDPKAEFTAIHNKFVAPINTTMQQSAQRNGWDFVPMIDAAARHGLCNCADGYENTIGASFRIQNDPFGVAHPNNKGHDRMYKPRLAPVLESKVQYIRGVFHLGRLFNDDARAKKEEEVTQQFLKLRAPLQLKYTSLLNNATVKPLYYKSQKLQQRKSQRAAAKAQFLQSLKPAQITLPPYSLPAKYTSFKIINEK
jgi:hypothetical protein